MAEFTSIHGYNYNSYSFVNCSRTILHIENASKYLGVTPEEFLKLPKKQQDEAIRITYYDFPHGSDLIPSRILLKGYRDIVKRLTDYPWRKKKITSEGWKLFWEFFATEEDIVDAVKNYYNTSRWTRTMSMDFAKSCSGDKQILALFNAIEDELFEPKTGYEEMLYRKRTYLNTQIIGAIQRAFCRLVVSSKPHKIDVMYVILQKLCDIVNQRHTMEEKTRLNYATYQIERDVKTIASSLRSRDLFMFLKKDIVFGIDADRYNPLQIGTVFQRELDGDNDLEKRLRIMFRQSNRYCAPSDDDPLEMTWLTEDILSHAQHEVNKWGACSPRNVRGYHKTSIIGTARCRLIQPY